MKVVDTQTHWYPRTLWEAYASDPGYPPCERAGDTYRVEILPGTWITVPPNFLELELQLEQMEAAGVDAIVSSSASFGDVDALPIDQAMEVAFALNEERASAERQFEGFVGLATIPWQQAEAAIEVLDDAVGRLGLRGVLLHSNIAGRPVDADYLRPVYGRISALGVPIFLHPARTVMEDRVRDYGLEIVVAYMFDTSIAALRLVFSGILDEFPELQFVHPHAGATLPYLAGRIDSSYTKPYALNRTLPRPPSAYLASFYTDTICQSADTLAFARRFYTCDHLLYGSDYPYFSPVDSLAFVRGQLSSEDAAKVLGGNAADLLRLDLDRR